jgi:TetR/AcrR family transcriptional repressor of lmrAB and yxaGH operons
LTVAAEAARRAIAQAAETSENVETFLTRVVRGMASDLERSNYKEGCPTATTALETAARPRRRDPQRIPEVGARNQAWA